MVLQRKSDRIMSVIKYYFITTRNNFLQNVRELVSRIIPSMCKRLKAFVMLIFSVKAQDQVNRRPMIISIRRRHRTVKNEYIYRYKWHLPVPCRYVQVRFTNVNNLLVLTCWSLYAYLPYFKVRSKVKKVN